MARPVDAMLPLGARSRALLLGTLLVGASAIILGGDVVGLSGGIDEELEAENGGTTTLLEGGCSCHNAAYTGNVVAVLEGVPAFYVSPGDGEVASDAVELNIRMSGGPDPSEQAGRPLGGFNLQVTQGTLGVPDGASDVQVLETGEATHTSTGSQKREWTVLWTPPDEAGPDAIFTLTVNAVNGNHLNDPGDEWGRTTMVAMGATRLGAAPEGEGGVHAIVSMGVNFYAYWVGVVSFIVLFAVLAATFFLLRYGESRHFTDWKDRPAKKQGEAPKSPMGTFVVLGIVLVVFLVAAVQIVRLV